MLCIQSFAFKMKTLSCCAKARLPSVTQDVLSCGSGCSVNVVVQGGGQGWQLLPTVTAQGIKRDFWTCHWGLEQPEKTQCPLVQTPQRVAAGLASPDTLFYFDACHRIHRSQGRFSPRPREQAKLTHSWFDNSVAELSAEYTRLEFLNFCLTSKLLINAHCILLSITECRQKSSFSPFIWEQSGKLIWSEKLDFKSIGPREQMRAFLINHKVSSCRYFRKVFSPHLELKQLTGIKW